MRRHCDVTRDLWQGICGLWCICPWHLVQRTVNINFSIGVSHLRWNRCAASCLTKVDGSKTERRDLEGAQSHNSTTSFHDTPAHCYKPRIPSLHTIALCLVCFPWFTDVYTWFHDAGKCNAKCNWQCTSVEQASSNQYLNNVFFLFPPFE